MPTSTEQRAEIERNYDFLMRNLAQFLPEQEGRYAALRNQQVLGFFDDPYDAHLAGKAAAENGFFSIQEVTDEPIELGVYALYVQQTG
jgi:hypothetical protein